MGDFGRPRHQTASINDGTAPAANRAVFWKNAYILSNSNMPFFM
jgi:hypothetical protein